MVPSIGHEKGFFLGVMKMFWKRLWWCWKNSEYTQIHWTVYFKWVNYTCELYFNKAVIKAKNERKQRISSFKQTKCHGDGFHSRVVCFGLGVEFFFFNSFEFILQGVFSQGLCSEALCLPPPLCPQARQPCPWPLTWFAPRPSPASPPLCPLLSCHQHSNARAATWSPDNAGARSVVVCLDGEWVWGQRYQALRMTNPICIFGFSCLDCSSGGPQTSQLFLEKLASQMRQHELN